MFNPPNLEFVLRDSKTLIGSFFCFMCRLLLRNSCWQIKTPPHPSNKNVPESTYGKGSSRGKSELRICKPLKWRCAHKDVNRAR